MGMARKNKAEDYSHRLVKRKRRLGITDDVYARRS